MEPGVSDLGFRVSGLGLGRLGFTASGLGVGVKDLRCMLLVGDFEFGLDSSNRGSGASGQL